MKDEKTTLAKVCEALGINTTCTWYDVGQEVRFQKMKSEFSGRKVAGGIAILCADFGIEEPNLSDVTEKQALQSLLEKLECYASKRIPSPYGQGVCTQKRWSQGQWVDFRNTVSEIIEIFGGETRTTHLSDYNRDKIRGLLGKTPASREHWEF